MSRPSIDLPTPQPRTNRMTVIDERSSVSSDRASSAPIASHTGARAWKDSLWRVYRHISECRVMALAAGVAFYALLAIFPALAALVSIYGLFADPATMSNHLDALANIVPAGAIDVIREQMTRLAAQGRARLGVNFLVGLCLSLWSANAGVKALFEALNIVYGEKETRSLVKLNIVALAFTAGVIVVLLSALTAVVGIPIALNYIGRSEAMQLLLEIARWPIIFICMSLAIACIYSYGPSRETPRWRGITWGSAFAALAWIATSVLFSWYVGNFNNYNETYGSLAAVIGLMTWIWLSVIAILIGATLDVELERHHDDVAVLHSPRNK
jgi:membrane protein